jgi:hypothetical protein
VSDPNPEDLEPEEPEWQCSGKTLAGIRVVGRKEMLDQMGFDVVTIP